MRISRDKYLNDLVARKGNGMVKVVTGARRCGKTYLLFDLFEDHLRAQGVDDDHIIEIALDDLMYERYRDPLALYDYVRSRITNREEPYYVLLDEVQYAISDEEMRGEEPPRLYGVLNGLLRMRNVDVYVTGSNSKMLSTDVMTEFRGRGDEVRVRPLSFAEFSRSFFADSSYMLSFSVLCSCVCSRLISPSVSSWHKQDNTLMHQSPGHIQRRTPYNF